MFIFLLEGQKKNEPKRKPFLRFANAALGEPS